MQIVCLVTTQSFKEGVWTPETRVSGLVHKPPLQFLTQNLSKKVQHIHKSLWYFIKRGMSG